MEDHLFKLIFLSILFFSSILFANNQDELKELVRETATEYYNAENIYDRFSGASTLIDLGKKSH